MGNTTGCIKRSQDGQDSTPSPAIICECHQEFNELHAKLHEAILKGDCETIKSIAKIHPVNEPMTIWKECVAYQTEHKQSTSVLPIHLAATYRREKSLLCLLELGADADIRDNRGRTALHLIITHWPNIIPKWSERKTTFQKAMASMQNRTEACLRIICEHGVEINAEVEGENRQTPLHLAVRYGAYSAISILAQNGARVNAMDQYGMTPLHMAAGTLNSKMAEMLISYGANVNSIIPHSGNTSLKLAVCTASAKGGKVLATDTDCIRLLLINGAQVNVQDEDGRAAIHDACQGGREEIVDLLLKFEADVNPLTKLGESPIFIFLERRSNLRSISLFSKLLSLSHPLKLTNKEGALPSGLLHPEFQQQKDFLVHLARDAMALQDICRITIRNMYGEKYKYHLKQQLPAVMCEFVYIYHDFSAFLEVSPEHKQLQNAALQEELIQMLGNMNMRG
ncbi:ankyrin repeat domain-containing protein 61 [Ambystoma mexicanum]|uniref:ankyrin repeat domain-containing protein 61 n=1 Tax=Ambystoma mexicanum TaxID=8296 RepID=UPI0037E9BE6F